MLHGQKALTLSFMPICDFPWECPGIKSYALQSVKNYFNDKIMRFIIIIYADLFTKSKINWYIFEIEDFSSYTENIANSCQEINVQKPKMPKLAISTFEHKCIINLMFDINLIVLIEILNAKKFRDILPKVYFFD